MNKRKIVSVLIIILMGIISGIIHGLVKNSLNHLSFWNGIVAYKTIELLMNWCEND